MKRSWRNLAVLPALVKTLGIDTADSNSVSDEKKK